MTLDKPQCMTIVENDDDIRGIIRRAFEQRGFAVRDADNGLKGILLVSQHPPELLIVDLYMPVVHGLTMLRTLARAAAEEASKEEGIDWFKPMAVICITGAYPEGHSMVEGAIDLGAVVLHKPFRLVQLQEAADQALQKAQLRTGEYPPVEDDDTISL